MNGAPLDDTVAERSHAVIKRHTEHRRNSSWLWVAANPRLPQAIQDLRVLPKTLGVSLSQFWCTHKSTL